MAHHKPKRIFTILQCNAFILQIKKLKHRDGLQDIYFKKTDLSLWSF